MQSLRRLSIVSVRSYAQQHISRTSLRGFSMRAADNAKVDFGKFQNSASGRVSSMDTERSDSPAATKTPVSQKATSTVDIAAYREEHQILLANEGVTKFTPLVSFDSTPFLGTLKNRLKREGYTEPTVIQAQSWPIALGKRDMISIAKTGSGKTCAFLLPAIHALMVEPPKEDALSVGNGSSTTDSRGKRVRRNPRNSGPKVLVLAPTRELAVQIEQEAQKFASAVGLKSLAVFGGAAKYLQINDIRRGVDIIIATPGRCNDLIECGELNLSNVNYVVLDEADRMLDMGFLPQIESIIECTAPTRQSLFFTATWPKALQGLAEQYLNNAVSIRVGETSGKLSANKSITQNVKVVSQRDKYDELLDLFDFLNPDKDNAKALGKTLIFVSRKSDCDSLAEDLCSEGFRADTLHGDKSQVQRDRVMTRFRSGQVQVLIATDVAGRGLDVKDIAHVINYDFPNSVEDYVHRIGRTGRAGATGKAFTFLTRGDIDNATELIGVMQRSEQHIPPELEALAADSRRKGSSGAKKGRSGSRDRGKTDKYGNSSQASPRGSSGGPGRGRGGFSERDFGGGEGGGKPPRTSSFSSSRDFDSDRMFSPRGAKQDFGLGSKGSDRFGRKDKRSYTDKWEDL